MVNERPDHPREGHGEGSRETGWSPVDSHLADILSGSRRAWPAGPSVADPEDYIRRIAFHGIEGIVEPAVTGLSGVPDPVRAFLKQSRLSSQFWESRHQSRLVRVCEELSRAGITPLFIKGTACAYMVYPDPAERTRGDSDLLVLPGQRQAADRILRGLGFETEPGFSRGLVVGQQSYEVVETGPDWAHVIDLHWRLSNSAVLSRLFSPEELLSRAVPLPGLAASAQAAAPVDAFLIAAFHRLAHLQSPYHLDGEAHYSADRFIWLADVDLLARGFSRDEWETLADRAREKGLAQACLSALATAARVFGTGIPEQVRERLEQPEETPAVESYLRAGWRARLWRDFMAQPGLRTKSAYLGEHLFPRASYMRARFGRSPKDPMPLLYLRRGAAGVKKLLHSRRGQP